VSVPASTVDHAPERGKQLRHTVDLVEHNETVFVVAEKQRRIGKLGPIFPGLQVEVD